jgi:hypothetical protein
MPEMNGFFDLEGNFYFGHYPKIKNPDDKNHIYIRKLIFQ